MRLTSGWWRRSKTPRACQAVAEVLQSYLDGEIDAADSDTVAEHLEACRDCGLEASTYARIKAALAQPSPAEVDPAAVERLRSFGRELAEGDTSS